MRKTMLTAPVLLTFVFPGILRPCDCITAFSVCDEVKMSDAVFIGTVESVTDMKSILAVTGVACGIALVTLGWSGAVAQPTAGGTISPLPLPDPKIAGFKFPEDEKTIIGWTTMGKQNAINLHGWGLWTALTTRATGTGSPPRIFETWVTPANVSKIGRAHV